MDDVKTIHAMFTDAWRFYRNHIENQKTDNEWEMILKDSGEIYNRYQTDLCKNILLVIEGEFERS